MDQFARGGMCSNPFGGEDRIDRINLQEFLEPNAPAEKVLYASIIQDAVSNYLYAFLGKNGTSAEEFFAAWRYFFKVSSGDKLSWGKNRIIKQSYSVRGEKVTKDRYLIDDEMELMCFDKHFEMSGLESHMHIDRFRAKLKAKRRKILTENWTQVETYIKALYARELSMIAEGQQVPFQVWDGDLLEILVDPPSPLHLANVIYVSNKLKRPRRAKLQKQLKSGQFHKLAEKLSTTIPSAKGDWGPLSSLLGADNDQVVSNNCHDSICSGVTGCSTTS